MGRRRRIFAAATEADCCGELIQLGVGTLPRHQIIGSRFWIVRPRFQRPPEIIGNRPVSFLRSVRRSGGVDRAVLCTTGVLGVRPIALGGARGVRGRRCASGLDRTSADRIAGPAPRPRICGADRRGIRCRAGLQADQPRPRHLGTAAALRCRGTHGGLRVVVAAALGLCAHLLLGPRPEFTGVDHTGHRHARGRRARFPAPSLRHVLHTSRSRCVGRDLSHVGAEDATAVARLPLRGHRDPCVGGIHVHLQCDHGNQLRLPQQESPPPRHCWTYWARGRSIC